MKIRICFLIIILLLSCKQNLVPRSTIGTLSVKSIKDITDKEVSALIKDGGYTNISGVVYIAGTSYQFHSGNLLNDKPANDHTLYEIGSITKTYTGILLSQAIQDGKISLNTDVRKYLKGKYKNLELDPNHPITLKHLITHTAGFPQFINCDIQDQTKEQQISCHSSFTKDKFFEKLKTMHLIDRSGNQYHYSNAGVQLVGYILEDIYQRSFEELVKTYVFFRSHEKNTIFTISTYSNNNRNISLGTNESGISMPIINGFYNCAGGIKSSTSSMLSYIKMYLNSNDPVIQRTMCRLAGDTDHGRAYAWNTYNFDKRVKMLYHNGGNPIPGVAIATALMPPLCTAGFGLATFNFSFFFGAFYLYTINCFFICIATFFVVKFLEYPSSIIDNKYEKRIRYGISFLILVMIIPSFYLAYNLFNEKKFTKTAEHFIQKEFENNGYTVIYKKISYNSSPKTIDVAFLNKKFTPAEISSYNKMLAENGLLDTRLNIRQDDTDLKSQILSEIDKFDANVSEKDLTIAKLRQELDAYKVSDSSLLKEIRILYPGMDNISYGKVEQYPETDSARLQFTMLYSGQNINDTQLRRWLEERIKEKNIKIINFNKDAER